MPKPNYQKLKRISRVLIAYVLYYSGFLTLLVKIKLKEKAIVLMYHRVLDKQEISQSSSQDGILVCIETFESQMRFLKKKINVISIDELKGHITQKRTFTSGSCLVTFDDGWKDNFINAYPMLKKYNIPAAIFLPTEYIGTGKRFWQERLNHMLKILHYRCKSDIKLNEKALNKFRESELRKIIISDGRDLEEKISNFVAKQKQYKEEIIEKLIDKMTRFLEIEDDKITQIDDFMNWDEIHIMSNGGVDFGSHGKSHRVLIQNESIASEEILESKKIIEKKLGKEINSFSYPNGSYTQEVVKLVKKSGYCIAFGTESGFVSSKDEPFTLKRINIHEDMTNSIPMFLARIAGLW